MLATTSDNKSKAVLFGAGKAGLAAKHNLAEQFQFIAFCDNDKSKVGQVIDGLPVVSPDDLGSMKYDRVLIASEFAEQIKEQLMSTHQIAAELIESVKWTDLKEVTLGQDAETEQFAVYLLKRVCKRLSELEIAYYVDAGTLLGIYRDNRLIPWDDDLDIAIDANYLAETVDAVERLLADLQYTTSEPWQLHQQTSSTQFGNVPKGAVRALKLCPKDADSKLPMMDIFVKYSDGEWMDYCLASRGIRMPSHHLQTLGSIEFAGQQLNIPGRVEDYLERHYGDWRTPKKDWGLGDLTNATVF
ncbi:nucleoside-diphosphate sugar epimerase/dehydratase [Bowmanella denitrificans]|uniref:nucleoside-diphosphate sugar epimerase/dehydratase n=1 Tax=Bowmanella denitrificans TaxID=366582 RepID=UPI0015598626|nr:LicD family protein [Bowmanella denitrificans]